MKGLVWLVFGLWACLPDVAFAQPAPEAFALVLGSNRPEGHASPKLRYADDDAVATHALLREAGIDSTLLVSLDADTRELHPDLRAAGATKGALDRAVSRIAARIAETKQQGRRSELYFFYSGHGDVEAGEGYVVLDDGRLTRRALYALLQRIGATTNHVMVDACMSSSLIDARGVGGRRRPYAGSPPETTVGELENTGFILSTSSARASHEWDRYEAGVFSHELRSALRGGADADLDMRISYAELRAFLERANTGIVPRYRPDVLVHPPSRDPYRPVLRWSTPASIELQASNWGHVYVETPQGERVIDVHPAAGQRAQLWTPSTRPLFLRKNDQSAEYVIDDATGRSVDPSTTRPPSVAAKGALSIAFEQLFAAPFSAAHVSAEPIANYAAPTASALYVSARQQGDTTQSGARRFTWWVAGGAAVALAAGITCSALSVAEYERVDDVIARCEACSRADIRREQGTGRALQTSANVLFGVAGAAAAAGVALFFLEPKWSEGPIRLAAWPGGFDLRAAF